MADESSTISPEGRARAEAELTRLRDVRRPEIVQSIKVAREFGDLKENAEYHAAREAQGLNEARIRVLEHHLATAEVAEAVRGDVAGAGSTVGYRDAGVDAVREVTLVHPLEAAAADGKVSVESPIGRGLLGTSPGQTVTIETPRGAKRIEVVSVA